MNVVKPADPLRFGKGRKRVSSLAATKHLELLHVGEHFTFRTIVVGRDKRRHICAQIPLGCKIQEDKYEMLKGWI